MLRSSHYGLRTTEKKHHHTIFGYFSTKPRSSRSCQVEDTWALEVSLDNVMVKVSYYKLFCDKMLAAKVD